MTLLYRSITATYKVMSQRLEATVAATDESPQYTEQSIVGSNKDVFAVSRCVAYNWNINRSGLDTPRRMRVTRQSKVGRHNL